MANPFESVDDFLLKIGPERAGVVRPLIDDIRANIDTRFAESVSGSMVCYVVPLSIFPKTYNKKPLFYCSLAVQKRHYALHMMSAYADSEAYRRIEERYRARELKLDMGKCCLRFKSLAEIDRDVVKEVIGMHTVQSWIDHYKACRNQ